VSTPPFKNPKSSPSLILRNIGFYFSWGIWTLLLFPLGFISLFLPNHYVFSFSRVWVKGIVILSRIFLGLTHRFTGLENLPSQGPYIVASKHQSTWETFVFNLIVTHPTFVLKRSLFYIPIIGWLLKKLDMIGVSKTRKQDKNSFLTQARIQGLTHNRPLIIFPEGTRTSPGQHPSYRQGIFLLYDTLKIPVIPIALNSGLFWGRRTFIKYPGVIDVVILQPIGKGLSKAEFMNTLITTIETTSNILQTKNFSKKTSSSQSLSGGIL